MDILTQAFQDMLVESAKILPKIIVSVLVLGIGLLGTGIITRMVKKLLTRYEVEDEFALLISSFVRWSGYALSVVVALQQVNFNVTAFLTGVGVAGFTIGYALQDVSQNLVAGFLLLIQRPFELEDAITVDDYSGTVQTVDLRFTELRAFDGTTILLPNTLVFTNPITNYGHTDRLRVSLSTGIAYGSDLEATRSLILNALTTVPGLRSDPAPALYFDELGPQQVKFTLYFWIDPQQTSVSQAKDAAIVRIHQAAMEWTTLTQQEDT